MVHIKGKVHHMYPIGKSIDDAPKRQSISKDILILISALIISETAVRLLNMNCNIERNLKKYLAWDA